ncbi:DUF5677 domain-containing protein [Chloroflexota bacterium]
MPIESFEPILSREFAIGLSKPIIDVASPILKESVNWATNLYPRCQTSKAGEKPEAFSLLALFLHVIQSIDAVEVLVSNSCGTPANLILRSAFEAKLSIEYICEKKSQRRSTAWAVKHILQEIEYYKNYNPTDPKGTQFRETWDESNWGQFMNPQSLAEASKAMENLEQKLKSPQYADVYRDYQQLITNRNRLPEWYSIDEGPKNLWALAGYLKHGVEYEMFYKAWSKQSHATDTHHLLLPMPDGPNVLGPLRSPLVLVNVSTSGLVILLDTMMLVIKKFRPDEVTNLRNWHRKEIFDKQMQLARLSLSALRWYEEMFMKKK